MPGPSFFSLSTTLPPPCQAVALNHSALSAASGGSSFTVMLTLRLGGGAASFSTTVALVPGAAFTRGGKYEGEDGAPPGTGGPPAGPGGARRGAPADEAADHAAR